MITVKATRQAPGPSQPTRENYVLPDKEKPSVIPQAFLLFLTGVAAYLSSFMPGQVKAAPEPERRADDGNDQGSAGPDAEGVAPGAQDTRASGEDEGSSDNVVPMPPRKFLPRDAIDRFLASDSPSLSFNRRDSGEIVPTTQIQPSNDNQAAPGPGNAQEEEFQSKSGSGGGGGGGGDDDARRLDDPRRIESNRAPKAEGVVRLKDLVGTSVYFISPLALLTGAIDPDGDRLGIAELSASSGTLKVIPGVGWIYTPDQGMLGDVTLKYRISDGIESVFREATFRVLGAPITGTAANDVLVGTLLSDAIDGGSGNDDIDARDGDDSVTGGDGDDKIAGGSGHDVVFGGTGNDIADGGDGDDRLFGAAGNDRLDGAVGNDMIGGEAGDDVITGGLGNDLLLGESGNDVVNGDEGDDALEGASGDDVLVGGAGDDSMTGGAGNDVLSDGWGSDVVEGDEGDDYVNVTADAADDSFSGGAGTDTLDFSVATMRVVVDVAAGTAKGAEIGQDLIAGFEGFVGSQGDDYIAAEGTSATMTGGDGDDIFEFQRGSSSNPIELVRKITDFTVGDRIIAAGYDIHCLEGQDDDEPGDPFDDIYLSDDDGNRPIKFRYEELETGGRTIVEVHDRPDPEDFYSIELAGRHKLEFTAIPETEALT